ncbi:MAG: hypothetical protein KF799_01590 [Bdellovibrionales bacterium]|nr:hypothetical protein [Bdellovibrionales bacterium]
MTRFLCQELLYEYASGTLDEHRRRDMEEYLSTCRDSQRELENLKKGLAYAQSVNSIHVTDSLLHGLEGFEPAWKKRLQSLTLWSFQRGWRMLPYTFMTLAIVLGLYVTKPWQQDTHRDLILAEQDHKEVAHPEGPLASPQVAQATDKVTAPAEGPPPLAHNSVTAVTEAEKPAVVPPVSTEKEPETSFSPTQAIEQALNTMASFVPFFGRPSVTAPTPKPVPTAAFVTPPSPPPPTPATAPAEAVKVADAKTPIHDLSREFTVKEPRKRKVDEASADDEKKDLGPGSGKGAILRGQIEVDSFDSTWPAVRDKIVSLGGRAAGNVELGWLRRSDESYFHFSLPESNYTELQSFLKTFGPVRISKERHPRVMPEGQIRIILTVKDGGKHEAEAEAP